MTRITKVVILYFKHVSLKVENYTFSYEEIFSSENLIAFDNFILTIF